MYNLPNLVTIQQFYENIHILRIYPKKCLVIKGHDICNLPSNDSEKNCTCMYGYKEKKIRQMGKMVTVGESE